MMSGTSLDGLDIAYCHFERNESSWTFQVEAATTVKYSTAWLSKLSQAHLLDAESLLALDHEFGIFLGKSCTSFMTKHGVEAEFISSHGHTIFHQPDKGFTYQLGNGNALHATTGLPVVYDFRSLDVSLRGEGAPLVPAGDKFLFSDYDVCLNLGGIANLSTDVKNHRIAYDICFNNMAFNYLASKAKKAFDKDGEMANAGEVNRDLLKKFDSIYKKINKKRPSLGREMFEGVFIPLLDNKKISINDKMATAVESAAKEIIDSIRSHHAKANVLCTGGGAFNSFLLSRMLDYAGDDISLIVPDDHIINFKEAMVFAFLGVLRVRGEINCLKTVTRASRDSSGGAMIGF